MEQLLKRVKEAAKHCNWVGTELKGPQILDVIALCEEVEKHLAEDKAEDKAEEKE